jgi:uncharacterized membrane protein
MAIKTRTVIFIILVAFFVFFSMAAFLISRFMVEIRQSGPENAIYVEQTINGQDSVL